MKASDLNFEDLKNLKKQLKLPIKKDLIYFKQVSYLQFQPFQISDFEIVKTFSKSPESKILKIYLENGETVNILSDYLSEMQKSNFTEIATK